MNLAKNYQKARKLALKRDHYTCQHCGSNRHDHEERLTVHHIIPWSIRPELRFDVDNLITLCRDCHKLAEKELFMQCEHDHDGSYILTEPRLIARCVHCNKLYRVKTEQSDVLS